MMEINNAPRIERLIDFVNSRGAGFDAGVDLLTQTEATLDLARRFVPDWKAADSAEIAQMTRLRDAVFALVSGQSEGNPGWAALNAIAGEVSFRLQFAPSDRVELALPQGNPIIAAVLQDIDAVMRSGEWGRIKICANHACGAAFFDTTRGKTQRWHSFSTCGNKNNVAAYRSRHAHAQNSPSRQR